MREVAKDPPQPSSRRVYKRKLARTRRQECLHFLISGNPWRRSLCRPDGQDPLEEEEEHSPWILMPLQGSSWFLHPSPWALSPPLPWPVLQSTIWPHCIGETFWVSFAWDAPSGAHIPELISWKIGSVIIRHQLLQKDFMAHTHTHSASLSLSYSLSHVWCGVCVQEVSRQAGCVWILL